MVKQDKILSATAALERLESPYLWVTRASGKIRRVVVPDADSPISLGLPTAISQNKETSYERIGPSRSAASRAGTLTPPEVTVEGE